MQMVHRGEHGAYLNLMFSQKKNSDFWMCNTSCVIIWCVLEFDKCKMPNVIFLYILHIYIISHFLSACILNVILRFILEEIF